MPIDLGSGKHRLIQPLDMNVNGVVVGRHESFDSNDFEPFVWTPGGGFRILPPVEDEHPEGAANAVNNSGTIVGQAWSSVGVVGILTRRRAVVWSLGGEVTDLAQVDPEANFFRALDVNEAGEIFGEAFYRNDQRPFPFESQFVRYNTQEGLVPIDSWREEPQIRLEDLEPSDFTSDPCGFGPGVEGCSFRTRRVTDEGFALGYAEPLLTPPSGISSNAIVWDEFNDEGIVLEERLTPSWSDWHVNYAIDRAPDGRILAAGRDAAGESRAFLLIPVPEPAAALLSMIGLTFRLVGRRIR